MACGVMACGFERTSDAAPAATRSVGGPLAPDASSGGEAPASPSATAASPQPGPTARFEVKAHKVVSGPRTVNVTLGSHAVIEVLADTPDDLHLHGYDKKLAVSPGVVARLEFTASIPGVFELELHSGVRLCEVRVR